MQEGKNMNVIYVCYSILRQSTCLLLTSWFPINLCETNMQDSSSCVIYFFLNQNTDLSKQLDATAGWKFCSPQNTSNWNEMFIFVVLSSMPYSLYGVQPPPKLYLLSANNEGGPGKIALGLQSLYWSIPKKSGWYPNQASKSQEEEINLSHYHISHSHVMQKLT